MRIIDLQKEFDEDMAKVRAKRGTPEVLAYAKDLRDIIDRASKDMDQTADLINTFHAAILEGKIGIVDDPGVVRVMANGMAMGYLLMKGAN